MIESIADTPHTQYGIAKPGCYQATWQTPGSGSLTALSAQWTLALERDADGTVTGWWIATTQESGRTFTGRSTCANGAFIAMLADRVGLIAEVKLRPEPADEPGDEIGAADGR